ncbi:glycosyltransferase 87 family protein [Lacinutrix sp. MedPE-SW]|uniref:glycosyltransferase 87 family protein n=1 Tax=Lacinutrix sp. MedPE-SW TaxID=1860087 RepID=UPI000921CE9C|nr:glycosyltransferase 87 family protein [Lacinutrix sp. MedPE-SW]OIQ23178.1 MAG: mannosyltransferase [Lacinutrix sp. MedPE-SW]
MFNSAVFKANKLPILLTIVSAVLYFTFAYNLERTAHVKLVSIYVILFTSFYFLIKSNKVNTNFLTAIAFLFRAIFILSIPNLSQDFYRFIWDGRLILQGINPYLYTPESYISQAQYPVAQAQELYNGMRQLNASHFTNYPPINQLCFIIAGVFAGKSIIGSAMVLRLLIIVADFGILYYGKKLLKQLKIPARNIFWYILNPFIIIELTGNLHFEGVMIFFLIWSLYLLHARKWKWAAVVFALSIATKLVPLMFLPLFFWWFLKKQTIKNFIKLITFYTIVLVTTLLLFAPFFSSQFIDNYAKTVGLWFSNFEFNASIYYIARAIGYWFRGYNEIAVIGKVLPVITVLFILYISFFKKNTSLKKLITAMLFSFTIYLFLSTTVHPWYIATILMLSVFTNYKFPLVWSFIVIISYLAYANTDNTENLWIIALEYVVVFSVFIWELLKKRNKTVIEAV